MIDDHLDDDGFRPEDWSFPFRPLPLDRRRDREDLSTAGISPDFVERAFARILDDQRRIRAEAELVDRLALRRDLLEAFAAPPPSPGFVDSTLGLLRAEQARGAAGLHDLLEHYAAPKASPDFVDRTLDALRLPAQAAPRGELEPAVLHPVAAPAPGPIARPAWRWIAAAAAAVVVAVLLATGGLGGGRSARTPESRPLVASASEFSPAALNSAFARADETAQGHLRLEPPDALLMLVAGGGSGE